MFQVVGLHTNVDFMLSLLDHPQFREGNVHTDFIAEHHQQLFPSTAVSDEHFCQAALSYLLQERAQYQHSSPFSPSHNFRRLNLPQFDTVSLLPLGAEESVSVSVYCDKPVCSVNGKEYNVSGRLQQTDDGVMELIAQINGVTSRTRVILLDRDIYLFTQVSVLVHC